MTSFFSEPWVESTAASGQSGHLLLLSTTTVLFRANLQIVVRPHLGESRQQLAVDEKQLF